MLNVILQFCFLFVIIQTQLKRIEFAPIELISIGSVCLKLVSFVKVFCVFFFLLVFNAVNDF